MNASMLLSRRRVSLFSQVFLGGPRSPPPPLSFERGSFRRRRCPQPLISSYEDAVRSGVNASWAIVAAMSSPRPRMPPVARVSSRVGPSVGRPWVAVSSLSLRSRSRLVCPCRFFFLSGGEESCFLSVTPRLGLLVERERLWLLAPGQSTNSVLSRKKVWPFSRVIGGRAIIALMRIEARGWVGCQRSNFLLFPRGKVHSVIFRLYDSEAKAFKPYNTPARDIPTNPRNT